MDARRPSPFEMPVTRWANLVTVCLRKRVAVERRNDTGSYVWTHAGRAARLAWDFEHWRIVTSLVDGRIGMLPLYDDRHDVVSALVVADKLARFFEPPVSLSGDDAVAALRADA